VAGNLKALLLSATQLWKFDLHMILMRDVCR